MRRSVGMPMASNSCLNGLLHHYRRRSLRRSPLSKALDTVSQRSKWSAKLSRCSGVDGRPDSALLGREHGKTRCQERKLVSTQERTPSVTLREPVPEEWVHPKPQRIGLCNASNVVAKS